MHILYSFFVIITFTFVLLLYYFIIFFTNGIFGSPFLCCLRCCWCCCCCCFSLFSLSSFSYFYLVSVVVVPVIIHFCFICYFLFSFANISVQSNPIHGGLCSMLSFFVLFCFLFFLITWLWHLNVDFCYDLIRSFGWS